MRTAGTYGGRIALAAAAAGVLAASGGTAAGPVTGTFRPVVQSNQAAPGGGFFSSFASYTLNAGGHVAGRGTLSGTPGGAPSTDVVFHVDDAGSLTVIAREGQQVLGGLVTLNAFGDPSLNDAGVTAFHSVLGSGNEAVLRHAAGTLTFIASEGNPAPDANGNFQSLDVNPAPGAAGDVVFSAGLSNTAGGQADNNGIFVGAGARVGEVVREGRPLPSGPGSFDGLTKGGVNDAGQVAFISGITGVAATADTGVFRGAAVAGSLTQVAREGQAAPDGNGTFKFLSSAAPHVNASGQVLFNTDLGATAGGTTDDTGIYRGSGGAVTQLAREGQDAPDGNGKLGQLGDAVFSDSGAAAFLSPLTNTAGGTSDDRGIFRGDGNSLIQIAREGQLTPAGDGVFGVFGSVFTNAAGQVAFQSSITGTAGGAHNGPAIFFYDDALGLIQVAREGTALFGSTITSLGFNGTSGELHLNDAGEVAFSYNLDVGPSGLAVWSVPEPGSATAVIAAAAALAMKRRRRIG